jgi:hypothetical protein
MKKAVALDETEAQRTEIKRIRLIACVSERRSLRRATKLQPARSGNFAAKRGEFESERRSGSEEYSGESLISGKGS